ncbi:tetratricopeptide repeat protein [Sphingosinicella sp. LHD-64]|uniref:tetratricopeptide repeat protein n=1 Tax=Sphingosinicella sp. LHD-64 TaxID=3072139 RepID=UPI00280E8F61|nr:tetratricopeptide repeat protein [Sphingosinicella sp. LHD-64]MDQ8755087.1 tetratricopeptide repeat protein [Sphingosinicella sp. LHD-64]
MIVQIVCAVHCVRNGRNSLWLMVILFFSLLGCAAYAWFEILPDYMGRREVRRVRQAAVKALDPDRDVRAARAALETADTAANRAALADALAEQGKWSEAIPHYEIADGRSPSPDRAIRFRLARACFEAGRNARARALLEALPPSSSPSQNDRTKLLLARTLDQDGESERALAIYADVGTRLPGAEAQCRQAALLLALGRRSAAVPVLGEVERRLKRMDSFERARDADMYDWAMRNLAELRAGGI